MHREPVHDVLLEEGQQPRQLVLALPHGLVQRVDVLRARAVPHARQVLLLGGVERGHGVERVVLGEGGGGRGGEGAGGGRRGREAKTQGRVT